VKQKATKRSLLIRGLLGLAVVLATCFSIIAAFIGFILSARITNNIARMSAISALVLLIGAGGGAWLMTRSLPFSGVYALIVLIVVSSLAARYMFRPIVSHVPPYQPRIDTQYWNLETGSHLAYTHFKANDIAHSAPIVYLHGGPAVPTRASSYDFYQQLTLDGYDVYLYDQVGTGGSDHLADISGYTLERNVADLEAIRMELGVEKIILIGTSWGGVLATHYLAAHPDNVEAVVFISPGVLGDRSKVRYDHSKTASSQDDSVLLPPFRMIMAGMLARINPVAAQQFAPQAELNGIYDAFITSPSMEYQVNCKGYQPDLSTPSRSGGGNYYANLLTLQSLKKTADPQPQLESNQTKALIMRGGCDYIPWEATYKYKTALPNSELVVIPNAGHAITGSQPDISLAIIRAFLAAEPLPLTPHED
jgi:pimeloyl-ACP methyl ester carboxylesterase